MAFLQGRAKSSGSKYLALVAAHAASDPFAKVKTMIKDRGHTERPLLFVFS